MKAQVSKLVLEELEVRADCIEEEEPEAAAAIRHAIAKIALIEDLKVDQLFPAEIKAVQDEMKVLETTDLFLHEWKQWYAAAAWFGFLDPWNGTSMYSGRKPKKLIIDGVAYERWDK